MKTNILKTIVAVLGIGVVLLTAGCQQSTVQQEKIAATHRWNVAKANVTYGVASEHLKAGQLDRAYAKVRECLTMTPTDVNVRLLLGRILIEQGQYAAAAAELTKVQVDAPQSGEAAYLLAVAQEKEGNLEEALANYRRAYTLDNSSLSSVVAASEVLASMGKLREAQNNLESYLTRSTSDPAVFELAGRLAAMSKEYAKAANYYQQAADLDPKNLAYRHALGQCQYRACQYVQAIDTLNNLVASSNWTPSVLVYSILGDSHMALGKYASARDAYQIATDLAPSQAGVWVNLAKASVALHDEARTILAARQALSIDENHLEATLLLGYAMLRDRQIKEALDLLTRATARHPESGMLQCLLGTAQARSGRPDEALKCYAAALRLEPDNVLARSLLESGAPQISKVN